MSPRKDKNNQHRGFYPRTEEHRRKMSIRTKGKVMSEESKRKLSIAKKGYVTSEETKEKLRVLGRKRKHTVEERLKMSASMKARKHLMPNWKGGITDQQHSARASVEYKLWREAVFKRDNYTCVWCGQRGGKIQADHIKAFADYPELRLAIDNGRTLCVECHKKTFDYGWKHRFHKED